MTTSDDRTERVDIPRDVDIEADFSPGEALTPVPPRTPSMCWRCLVPATYLSAAAPAPRCESDARDHYDTCSIANDLSWAICASKLMLRFGPFEYFFGPERRAPRTLAPLGAPERRRVALPPIPPREDGE